MKTKILKALMLYTLIGWMPLAAQYSGGSGTAEDPYKISTLDDLNELSVFESSWSSYFIMTQDIDAAATKDTEEGFKPIGYNFAYNNKKSFTGIFDGQDYTISNLYINRPTENTVALFGFCGSYSVPAEINNLNITNAEIVGKDNTGILAGKAEYVVISNVHTQGSVIGNNYVGALAGYAMGGFSKCTSAGDATGNQYVGGLVGNAVHSSKAPAVNYYICSSSANATGTSSFSTYVGGFAGMLGASAHYCYATGNVTGPSTIGGFVGQYSANGKELAYSFSNGKVSGSSSNIGGFVGAKYNGDLRKCYTESVVTAVDASTPTKLNAFAGNFSPSPYNKIEDCYYNSDSTTATIGLTGIAGLTSTEFADQASFPSWNFPGIWEMTIIEEANALSRPYPKGMVYDFFIDYTITIPAAGSISGQNGWFKTNENVTFVASEAIEPYQFDGWYYNDILITKEYTLDTVANEDIVYVAKYIAGYSGGKGTEETPYQLANYGDLELLQATESDYDKYFIITADIDASASANVIDAESGDTIGFTPIGNMAAQFSGNIDGQGYTISKLYINNSNGSKVGLLGQTNKATLKNINITEASISAYEYVAGLAGYALSSTITNCHVDGVFKGTKYVAPIVAMASNVTFFECSTSGSAEALEMAAGGFVANGSTLTAELCNSSADASAKTYAGGFAGGQSGGIITNCYATGDASAVNYAGGFVGSNSGTINVCFATGDVTQKDITGESNYGFTGGFVGYHMGRNVYISDSYSTGKVYGIKDFGGFCGLDQYNSIQSCVYDLTTSEQADQDREGVLALTTEEFAEISNFEGWDFGFDWELGINLDFDTVTRPYQKILLGYDYIVDASSESELSGTVTADKTLGWFKNGDSLTLMTTVNLGYEFDGWYLADEKLSSDTAYTFVIENSGNYVAKYTLGELTFAGGSGSPLNPYQISNYEQLCLLGNRLLDLQEQWFILINDIDASESATANNGRGFLPIGFKVGYVTKSFEGNFNGNGYSIKNLNINRPEEEYLGIFRYLDGDVQNLNIEEPTIIGNKYVGALAGASFKNSQIDECHVTGGTLNGLDYVGGITGEINSVTGSPATSRISSLSNSSVEGTNITGQDYVGGLAGRTKSIITFCHADATVNGRKYVGGLIGYLLGQYNYDVFKVANSYAKGKVKGTQYVGGLIGNVGSYTYVMKSFSLSEVVAVDLGTYGDGLTAGGLVAELNGGHIYDSYALGSVSALDKSGGFAAIIKGSAKVERCYTATQLNILGNYKGALAYQIMSSTSKVIDTYADVEITGIENLISSNSSTISDFRARTSAQLAMTDSLPAFDFNAVWEIKADSTIDSLARPYLRWQSNTSEVSITTDNENRVNISGAGWYNIDQEATLVANPVAGWRFVKWMNGDAVVDTMETFTFTVEADTSYVLTAVIEEHFTGKGAGSEEDPYQIETLLHLEELTNLPNLWQSHFILMNDIDAAATKDWHVADHDKNVDTPDAPRGFYPIGDDVYGSRDGQAFKGTFDGQGYTISKLYIDRPLVDHIGLFGSVGESTIKNLTMADANITGRSNAGVLIGSATALISTDLPYTVTIDSCHVTGSKINTSGLSTGALAGKLKYATISNSTVENVDINGAERTGAFIGEITLGTQVKLCSSEGTLYALGNYVGGFIGWVQAGCSIDSAFASVDVTGVHQVGGFIGSLNTNNQISNSYATGEVYVGGVNGVAGGFVGYMANSTIADCYATGDTRTVDLFAGGFAGYIAGNSSTSVTTSYATGNVKGLRLIGGFAGGIETNVAYCYSTGDVDGSTENPSDMDLQVGGFAGRISNGGKVSNSFNIGNVKGHVFTAGFTGVNAGIIEYCYSAATIESTGYGPAAFVSYNDVDNKAIIRHSYYDNTLTQLTGIYANGENETVTGVSTEDFGLANNFDLDFDGYWKVSQKLDIDTISRPYLKWENGGAQLKVNLSTAHAAIISGQGWYNDAEQVNISVSTPQPGMKFSHWEYEGNEVSSDIPYTFNFTGSEDVSYTAVFVEDNILTKGDGSKATPYEIATYAELVCLTNVPSIWNKHFKLTADIDATASEFLNDKAGLSPIGNRNHSKFTGSFDGQDYEISNVYFNRTDSSYSQALFGYVGDTAIEKVVIKNLKLANANSIGTYGVATLVGDMANAEINNCHSSGSSRGYNSYIGGLVGRATDNSLIYGSSFSGTVFEIALPGQTSCGGLVGYNLNSNIERSYAITDSVVSYAQHAGGLVGYNADMDFINGVSDTAKYGIKQSFAISAYVSGNDNYVGGLVGANKGSFIHESYAVSALLRKQIFSSSYGGLVGGNDGGDIKNSYFNTDREGAIDNDLGTGINTTSFAKEEMFSTWNFDADWKIAIGTGREKRPYLAEMPMYNVTFKVKGAGKVSPEGETTEYTEFSDAMLLGFDSRQVTAIAGEGANFIQWEVENGGPWDTENETTMVPGHLGRNYTLVAVFEGGSSINENVASAINVYPNPASQVIFIEGINNEAMVEIAELSGRIVYTTLARAGQALNISQLNEGAYVVMVKTEAGLKKSVFIKQ